MRLDSESIRDEKVKVLKAIPALEEKNIVRGQFRGYLDEKGVAPDSKVETFAALRLRSQFLAMAGSSVLHPRREIAARDMYRNRLPVAKTSNA